MAATAGMETWACNKCKSLYVDDNKDIPWIECTCCFKTYCPRCVGMTKTVATVMKRDDVIWVCPDCIPVLQKFNSDNCCNLRELLESPIPQMNQKVMDGIEQIKASTDIIMRQQDKMDTLLKQMETDRESKWDTNLEKFGEKITREIEEVKTTVKEDVPKLWTEVVAPKTNNRATAEDMVVQVKRAMLEVAESEKEQELRAKGIVVYKLAESEGETKEERVEEDRYVLEELLQFLGFPDTEIVYAERLGRFSAERCNENKFRPIKVRFTDQATRDNVLRSLYKLRNAPEKMKALSIRQDLNNNQRAELRRWTDEAFNKSRNSLTMHYRVKGEPGNYRLMEMPKKFPPTNA